MKRASWIAIAIGLLGGACKDAAPRDVPASDASADGIEVKTRRSTVMNGKLAWGGLVTNTTDRFVRGVDISVAGATAHVDLLPPHYGTRLEINGMPAAGVEKLVPSITKVEAAPPEEKPFAWQPASVHWMKPLPEGVAFSVEKDEKCAGVLGKKGEPAMFRCVLGVKNTGTRAARDLKLEFELQRGGPGIVVKPSPPTALPIEPGDAVVFYVQASMPKPSETLLKGTAEAR
jgi:hypothetical protein